MTPLPSQVPLGLAELDESQKDNGRGSEKWLYNIFADNVMEISLEEFKQIDVQWEHHSFFLVSFSHSVYLDFTRWLSLCVHAWANAWGCQWKERNTIPASTLSAPSYNAQEWWAIFPVVWARLEPPQHKGWWGLALTVGETPAKQQAQIRGDGAAWDGATQPPKQAYGSAPSQAGTPPGLPTTCPIMPSPCPLPPSRHCGASPVPDGFKHSLEHNGNAMSQQGCAVQ